MLMRPTDWLDTLAALRHAELECDDAMYVPGCGQDDTFDSSGQPLRPSVNEGGEPWWM